MGYSFGDLGVHASLGLLASLTYGLVAHRLGLYRLNQLLERERDNGRVWASWGLTILVLTVALFLLKSGEEASRGSVVCFFVLGGAGLVLARRTAKRRLRSALMAGAIRGRRAIVIGTQSELTRFARRDLLVRFGLDEVERVLLPRDELFNRSSGLQKADAEAVLQRVRGAPVEEIILALSWSHQADIELLLDRLRVVPLPVRLLPDRAVSAILHRQASKSQRSYVVEMQRSPLNSLECWAKRLLDVTVAATSLLLLSPILVVVAAAIKLESKGPVIFRQRRHGFNGQSFVIYKLRTMKVLEDGAAVVQACKGDPRVTRVGRLLRQTSIDELPQLWNVLQGHMSIVGPRPHALVHDYEYGKTIANYAFRHHVKPGITGWAQVQGYRGGTPRLELMERRITLDLWYINNWSLTLDIYIMLRTFFELVRRRNAY
jgi:undecaprenyl-phosphate galactose phosphotransferase/putative colanic acid biosynthesis UDP-glucose lipid carrier transferase